MRGTSPWLIRITRTCGASEVMGTEMKAESTQSRNGEWLLIRRKAPNCMYHHDGYA